jgi:hypothetical protein
LRRWHGREIGAAGSIVEDLINIIYQQILKTFASTIDNWDLRQF